MSLSQWHKDIIGKEPWIKRSLYLECSDPNRYSLWPIQSPSPERWANNGASNYSHWSTARGVIWFCQESWWYPNPKWFYESWSLQQGILSDLYVPALQDLTLRISNQDTDTTCTFCLEKRLPVEVFSNLPWIRDPVPKEDGSGKYLLYQEIVGKETTEKHRPSCATESQCDIEHKDLYLFRQKYVILCFKPHCLYLRYALVPYQLKEIECLECETWYVCGSPLSPLDEASYIVREGISCPLQ